MTDNELTEIEASADVHALVAEVRRLSALAAINENRRTFRWVGASEEPDLLDAKGDIIASACADLRGVYPVYVHVVRVDTFASAKEAMTGTEKILRAIHAIRPFDVVKGIGE